MTYRTSSHANSLSLSMSSLTNAGHQYQQCVHLLVTYHRLGLSSPGSLSRATKTNGEIVFLLERRIEPIT
jgi:hypothetical protein